MFEAAILFLIIGAAFAATEKYLLERGVISGESSFWLKSAVMLAILAMLWRYVGS
jgi:hypothetical protein